MYDNLHEIINLATDRARAADREHESFARLHMGRVYHNRTRAYGAMALSDIVTVPLGRDLYLQAAAEDDAVQVCEDATGELSGRQTEARDLPANFTILYVRGDPDSLFWDTIESTIDLDVTNDTDIVPQLSQTSGLLTQRQVYGLPEIPRSL